MDSSSANGGDLDSASVHAWRSLPAGSPTASSPPAWSRVLVRRYEEPATAEQFTTAPTSDLLLVVQDCGSYHVESRRAGRWRGVDYHPGAVGVTAPGVASVLRWRPVPASEGHLAAAASTTQVHLAESLVAEVARALGAAHRPASLPDVLPDVLSLERPDVLATARALSAAAGSESSRLAGESLALALAAQLLHTAGAASAPAGARGGQRVRALSPSQLASVVDHLHAHLARDIGLDECAAVVATSTSHFLRAFTAATGTTPHRYLVRLRMDRAAQLLRTTELSVLDVAISVGYAGTSHFAATFARHHGDRPSSYRRAPRDPSHRP